MVRQDFKGLRCAGAQLGYELGRIELVKCRINFPSVYCHEKALQIAICSILGDTLGIAGKLLGDTK